MGATMTSLDKWERARKRREKIGAEELRKAMTEAWENASRDYRDAGEAKAATWDFLCGWLRGMEQYAGIETTMNPDGTPHP